MLLCDVNSFTLALMESKMIKFRFHNANCSYVFVTFFNQENTMSLFACMYQNTFRADLLARINYKHDIINGDARFSDIGRKNDLQRHQNKRR